MKSQVTGERWSRRSFGSRKLLAGLALALFPILFAGPALAQSSITASAVVVGGNLDIARERDLDFGNVIRGVPATIVLRDGNAGRFRITGSPGADVSLNFLLPVLLASGPNTMPISFGPSSAGHYPFNVPRFATLFDPRVPATAQLRNQGPTGYLFVWLGGTVSPTALQAPGVYTGNVTLVVSYTGS